MIKPELHIAAMNEYNRCMAIAAKLYFYKCPVEIEYGLRGTTAGIARSSEFRIVLNDQLFNIHGAEAVTEVVAHELAHVVAYHVFPAERTRMKGNRRVHDHHGASWQRVMMDFGKDPKRLHNFSTEESAPRTEYVIVCTKCSKEWRINRQRPPRMDLRRRMCDVCNTTTLVWQHETESDRINRLVPPTATVPHITASQSKIEQCYTIFVNNIGVARQHIIQLMMSEVGITKPHASTYYQTCKKRADDNRTAGPA